MLELLVSESGVLRPGPGHGLWLGMVTPNLSRRNQDCRNFFLETTKSWNFSLTVNAAPNTIEWMLKSVSFICLRWAYVAPTNRRWNQLSKVFETHNKFKLKFSAENVLRRVFINLSLESAGPSQASLYQASRHGRLAGVAQSAGPP